MIHNSEKPDIKDEFTIIRDIYLVKEWLGKGKFGMVYKAVDVTDDQFVAKSDTEYSSIKHEVRLMSYLFQHKFRQLPKIHWYGIQDGFTHLVMCYYDASLDSMTSITPKIINQCIRIMESIHNLFVLHRDIKPQNFMLRGDNVFLIDYGLATFYVDDEGEHVPNKKQATITGTPKFVSFYNHIGNTLSRRDDLISLGYLFFHMLRNKHLPWSGGSNSDAMRITTLKSWENIHKFTSDFLPLNKYMKYCYDLNYSDVPDYGFLLTLFA